jgi:hypothetical protein
MSCMQKTTPRKKIPKCMEWVLTGQSKDRIVLVQTEWPFPVSIKPNGETHINVSSASATQVRNPPPEYEPAPF